jgi:hypothetical protein
MATTTRVSSGFLSKSSVFTGYSLKVSQAAAASTPAEWHQMCGIVRAKAFRKRI